MKTFTHPIHLFPYVEGTKLSHIKHSDYCLIVKEVTICSESCKLIVLDCYKEKVYFDIVEDGKKKETIDICFTPSTLHTIITEYCPI